METKDIVVLTGAIIAAALAAAKLVADKESKVSDFRVSWINSFRESLADCLASAHVISGRIRIKVQHCELSPSDIASLENDLTAHWNSFRRSFRLVMLHLNFAETSIPLLGGVTPPRKTPALIWADLVARSDVKAEQIFIAALRKANVDELRRASPAALELVSELCKLQSQLLGPYSSIGKKTAYELIDGSITRATLLGNLVIKPEWNRIKAGERAHRWAIRLAACLVVLGFAGLFVAIR